jgi:hypothetical protein
VIISHFQQIFRSGAIIELLSAAEYTKGAEIMENQKDREEMETAFAAELFAQLSEAAQREIIDLTRSLLSEK